jgi:hypothetical protein
MESPRRPVLNVAKTRITVNKHICPFTCQKWNFRRPEILALNLCTDVKGV